MTDAPAFALPADLLERIRTRAAEHDRDSTFPHDDLAELAATGYLRAFVPVADGGLGLGLEQVSRLQVELAKASGPTALAVNMHLVVTGVAATLAQRGDDSMRFVLTDAAAGEVYAFGNSEAGNDLVMFDSLTAAVRGDDGSYTYTGRKIFTSLSPVWTRLATFGRDDSDPDNPVLVHGVVSRDTPGIEVLDDWDVIGMRATQSCTTVLDGATAPADRVYRSLPVGPSADPFIFCLFAVFETLLAAVYTGIGARGVELAVEQAHRRRSRKNGGRPGADDPDVRRRVAQAAMSQDALYYEVFGLARDIDELVDHGSLWFAKIVGLKVRATQTAQRVVEQSVQVGGGGAYRSGSELGRLYRDVIAGMFHPSSEDSALSTIANTWLGPIGPAPQE